MATTSDQSASYAINNPVLLHKKFPQYLYWLHSHASKKGA